ncbi:hypothetical protein HUJ04_001082 [Dendroctonus ponderosae]|nr:hypothetical protein HUJ04_001082 [Dendroctonus ponderosae]
MSVELLVLTPGQHQSRSVHLAHISHLQSSLQRPYVLAWKKGIAVLSAGSVKVSPDPRVQLINGFNLEIREVGPQDSGDYVCQIGTLEPREITHTLEVLVCVEAGSEAIVSFHELKQRIYFLAVPSLKFPLKVHWYPNRRNVHPSIIIANSSEHRAQ